jgi:hypothetical protein
LDSNIAWGALFIVWGLVGILTRKYSYEQAKKGWIRLGFPMWSEGLYEMCLVVAGFSFIAFGITFIVIAMTSS